jgi:ribonuclease-3
MTDNTQLTTYFKNGDFKLYILNEKNIYITKEYINGVLKKYGLNYKIKNLNLFQNSMIHVSYMNRVSINDKTIKLIKDLDPIDDNLIETTIPLQNTSYDTLEFLGDAVIHLCLAKYLRIRYPDKGAGFLTNLRAKIENTHTLSKLSKIIGLEKYAIIPKNMEIANARVNNIPLTEDIFESFIGALSEELSFEQIYEFIINLIEKELNFAEMISVNDNYKDLIMQKFHKLKWGEPKYIDDTCNNLQNNELHKYKIIIKDPNGNIVGTGYGASKNKAQLDAAENCLINLNVINDTDVTDNVENDYYGELDDNYVKNINDINININNNNINDEYIDHIDDDLYGYMSD